MPKNGADKKKKSIGLRQITSPLSSGNAGPIFENRVQALFVALMIANGFAPCLKPPRIISKIKLQGKYDGYETDDGIVFTTLPDGTREAKILCQAKRSVKVAEGNNEFSETIASAWADFNNPKVFSSKTDVFALIVPCTNGKDLKDLNVLLERARHSETDSEFFDKIRVAKFTSLAQKKKLLAVRNILKINNSEQDVSDLETWRFLRTFHVLMYDLDLESGSSLSLVYTILSQNTDDPRGQWTRILDKVLSANPNAGTITRELLLDDILSPPQKKIEAIPKELVPVPSVASPWNPSILAPHLAVASLLGAWDEGSPGDKEASARLVNEEFQLWIPKLREAVNQPSSPVLLKNGLWKISERLQILRDQGNLIFDEHLDRFQKVAIEVLSKECPALELAPKDRMMAGIYGKKPPYSSVFKRGIAEGLALLGNNSELFGNSSFAKAKFIPAIVVRTVFENSDWRIWASLDGLLPLLAEAAPEQFLQAMEDALLKDPNPFQELYSQEDDGVFGKSYMPSILWALETLAWEEQFLLRVTLILGELSKIDPGGNSMNRPANSLTTIFLPWHPQTLASVDKRRIAVQTLLQEFPEIGWHTLLALLPNQQQMSMGSRKPEWRPNVADTKGGIDSQEYGLQVSTYARMALDFAGFDATKLAELSERFENVPIQEFEALIDRINSNEMANIPEDQRLPLWRKLVEIVEKHRQFSDADWAMPKELLEKFDAANKNIAPHSLIHLYRRLFDTPDYDLYDTLPETSEETNSEEIKLSARRETAVREILDEAGLKAILGLASSVQYPSDLGFTIGSLGTHEFDAELLPVTLDSNDAKRFEFIRAYIWGKFRSSGWAWVDEIDFTKWTKLEIAHFLTSLPFTDDNWDRVEKLLGNEEGEYWSRVNSNPYVDGSNLTRSVRKLIEHDRPYSALGRLHFSSQIKKVPLDQALTLEVLEAATSTQESVRSTHQVCRVIKTLQADPTIDPDAMLRIEWAYLPLLNRFNQVRPKFLEQKLADSASFFCETIKRVYRSSKEIEPFSEPTPDEARIATNAYRLLEEWRTIPGTQADGAFSSSNFTAWVNQVKRESSESGHLEQAMARLGHVLIHTPADPTGLWIDKTVAKVLNAKDASKIRSGFKSAFYNSRGVHTVVASGTPERNLAAKYTRLADDVEANGFVRLGTTLRELASTYSNEADRVIEEHRRGPADN